jgi:hypothetical protein
MIKLNRYGEYEVQLRQAKATRHFAYESNPLRLNSLLNHPLIFQGLASRFFITTYVK